MNRSKIKELIELVETSDIAELEVHYFGGRKVIIRKSSSGVVPVQSNGVVTSTVAPPSPPIQPAAQQSTPVPQEKEPPKEEIPAEKKVEDEDRYISIKAPMVGTFYRKPSPDSPPYVEVGDHISKGQVVCLIEAMKLFNEVKSEVSGKIVKISVEDASPVEFGQVLFLLEPE
ncbi:acetyl-CoA carboxylase biotin carboxyl carrier protein [bacterium]|nr:acetyl-CoA carboxylase biotin carboxyl carrier protein [bacterium]